MPATINVSPSAVASFLSSLPPDHLSRPSTSHLPVTFPLAFPSSLHTLNLLSTLHLVYSLLSHPSHADYFVNTLTDPVDTATRGVLGLYLASEPDWSASNLLSSAAWGGPAPSSPEFEVLGGEHEGTGLSPARIAEVFGIQVMRERPSENMPGITVGERDPAAARIVDEIVMVLKETAGRMRGACLGEEVKEAIEAAHEAEEGEEDKAWAFAERFCSSALALVPYLAESFPLTTGALPTSPLRLLQDLAFVQSRNSSTFSPSLPLPSYPALAVASPLPLPLPALVYLGILSSPALPPSPSTPLSATEIAALLSPHTVSSDNSSSDQRSSSASGPALGPKLALIFPTVDVAAYTRASIEVCSEIVKSDEGRVTPIDVLRIMGQVVDGMDVRGVGWRLGEKSS